MRWTPLSYPGGPPPLWSPAPLSHHGLILGYSRPCFSPVPRHRSRLVNVGPRNMGLEPMTLDYSPGKADTPQAPRGASSAAWRRGRVPKEVVDRDLST